ncbi:MAG: aldo/keto reductase [Gemmatimonadaceae bacterium]|jgi:aryl-alcohol dehydrogenase-like predicted oxidoreductase
MHRRDFIEQTATAAAAVGGFPASLAAIERVMVPGGIERRALGRTGEKLSVVAFGGIVLNQGTPDYAVRLVRDAFEAGVTHFDVAPQYGTAEEMLGPALLPYRNQVFLSCKTLQRKRDAATADLNRSLQRLRTDHVDLYQLHSMSKLDDVDTVFADDGAIRALEDAKRAGKVRFLGFSAHSEEAAMALMSRYEFDSIMFPVNYATWHAGNFGPQVLAKAREKGMGIIAIKSLAKRPWADGDDRSKHPNCWYLPMTDDAEAAMGLRFTLSHPVTTAIMPGSEPCLRLGMKLAPQFTPLSAAEADAMKARGQGVTPLFRAVDAR